MSKASWVLLAMGLLLGVWGVQRAGEPRPYRPLVFDDVRAQTQEFIDHDHSIWLNAEQEKLKERVLSGIPAPCCSEYSIATCCCPCNLAKAVWGLSKYAIARLNYDEVQLRKAVLDWLHTINPAGFSGDACTKGGCGRSFAANGCGGMNEAQVVF